MNPSGKSSPFLQTFYPHAHGVLLRLYEVISDFYSFNPCGVYINLLFLFFITLVEGVHPYPSVDRIGRREIQDHADGCQKTEKETSAAK